MVRPFGYDHNKMCMGIFETLSNSPDQKKKTCFSTVGSKMTQEAITQVNYRLRGFSEVGR